MFQDLSLLSKANVSSCTGLGRLVGIRRLWVSATSATSHPGLGFLHHFPRGSLGCSFPPALLESWKSATCLFPGLRERSWKSWRPPGSWRLTTCNDSLGETGDRGEARVDACWEPPAGEESLRNRLLPQPSGCGGGASHPTPHLPPPGNWKASVTLP